MPQKDFIIPEKTISKSLTYNQKELYKYLKKWFQERHYIVVEQNYKEKVTPENKRIYSFDWYTEKRVDDATKLTIELGFNAEVENVKIELKDGSKKTSQKGDVSISVQGYIQKDTEDEWALSKEKPLRRLTREFYDRMVAKGKYATYESQMRKDMKAIMSDFKTYLKTHRYD